MSLKTVISTVREIEKGTTVSYGRTFTAERKTKTAVVAIGYADGYPRILSGNDAHMIVRGQFAPVIGRVCMDMCVLDVTDIDGVSAGDVVTVIGTDGELTVSTDEIAKKSGTISYEITCAVSKRVPRVYIKDGKRVEVKNYFSKEY
jgi:alanine racemase